MSVGLSHSSSVSRTQEALSPEVSPQCRMGSTIQVRAGLFSAQFPSPASPTPPLASGTYFRAPPLLRSLPADLWKTPPLPSFRSPEASEAQGTETPKRFGPAGSCLLSQCEQQKGQEKEKHPGPLLKPSTISLAALHGYRSLVPFLGGLGVLGALV